MENKEKIDELIEALEFYAKESRYQTPLSDETDLNNVGMPFPDKGHKARRVLESIRGFKFNIQDLVKLPGSSNRDYRVKSRFHEHGRNYYHLDSSHILPHYELNLELVAKFGEYNENREEFC